MKRSKIVKLVLVTTLFAACQQQPRPPKKNVHIRTDTTSKYTTRHVSHGNPVGFYSYSLFNRRNGTYSPTNGYHSDALSTQSSSFSKNVSSGNYKGAFGGSHGSTSRGGFGKSSSVSSKS